MRRRVEVEGTGERKNLRSYKNDSNTIGCGYYRPNRVFKEKIDMLENKFNANYWKER